MREAGEFSHGIYRILIAVRLRRRFLWDMSLAMATGASTRCTCHLCKKMSEKVCEKAVNERAGHSPIPLHIPSMPPQATPAPVRLVPRLTQAS